MTRSASQRRAALLALFFLPGLAISSWVTRTPAIRDILSASTAQVGLILLGLSIGSMAGILLSGRFVARFGTRAVAGTGLSFVTLSLPLIALGAATADAAVVTGGLVVFGLGMGTAEIAMNVEAAAVEKILGAPVLPSMHGFFSLGTTVGAVLGIVLTAVDFPVAFHLLLVAGFAAVVIACGLRFFPARSGVTGVASADDQDPGDPKTPFAPWRDRRLLLIGVIVLAMALAEGSANDWLPLLMVDDHGFDAAWGSAVYAVFAGSMASGRLGGGWFIVRFGRVAVVRVSALLGAVGIALVIFADSQVVAALAVILWGLGSALAFPVAISAAGDAVEHAAQRVSFAASSAYVAFLVGPPLLGFLGNAFGLRDALIVVLGLVALTVACAGAVGPARARRETSRAAA
jgi:fucose permease